MFLCFTLLSLFLVGRGIIHITLLFGPIKTYLKTRFLLVDKDEDDEIINTLSLYCLAVIRSVLGMLGVA